MPAYNFQQRFAKKVASGEKRHTIRARRKDGQHPRPGQPFRAYTGMRTKKCEPVLFSTISKVQKVHIGAEGIVTIDYRVLNHDEREALADADEILSAAESV